MEHCIGCCGRFETLRKRNSKTFRIREINSEAMVSYIRDNRNDLSRKRQNVCFPHSTMMHDHICNSCFMTCYHQLRKFDQNTNNELPPSTSHIRASSPESSDSDIDISAGDGESDSDIDFTSDSEESEISDSEESIAESEQSDTEMSSPSSSRVTNNDFQEQDMDEEPIASTSTRDRESEQGEPENVVEFSLGYSEDEDFAQNQNEPMFNQQSDLSDENIGSESSEDSDFTPPSHQIQNPMDNQPKKSMSSHMLCIFRYVPVRSQ